MAEIVTVRNAGDEPETTAEILVQNQVNYQPKISVIIPVYNVEKYLRRCLESVLAQTLQEIEIICVDDGSTDGSLEILSEYAATDKRISVIKQQNLFAGVARNAGLAVAQGEFVLFLDSDDFFELNMLERMYDTAQKDGADVVVCEHWLFDDLVRKDIEKRCMEQKLFKISPFFPCEQTRLLHMIIPAPWNKLFRRELFERHDIRFEKLRSSNDVTGVYTALFMANKISVIKEAFAHYRINTKGQISADRGKSAGCILHALDRLEKNLERLGKRDVFIGVISKIGNGCLNYEKMHCDKRQLEELERDMPKVLSLGLYQEIKKIYLSKKGIIRRYYFFGLPLVKIVESGEE